MFINPHKAIYEGWIQFPDWMDGEFRTKCIQPNAIDITMDRMFTFGTQETEDQHFMLSETSKRMRPSVEVLPHDYTGMFHIANGTVDVMSDFFVKLPDGVAAMLIVRSTLNRNGLFITSGLYDSGFENCIGFCLHNRGYEARIAPHTRVGQIIFVDAATAHLYQGSYNNNKSQHWSTIQP